VIIAALESCCRLGELLTLQWRDVSMARKEMTLRADKTKDDEDRVIPISARLHAVLEMGRSGPDGREYGPEDYVFGNG
jgi:integrase